jgi:hypothetical protein
MLLRLTKLFNYVLLSPSRGDVNGQAPPSRIALLLEPDRFWLLFLSVLVVVGDDDSLTLAGAL